MAGMDLLPVSHSRVQDVEAVATDHTFLIKDQKSTKGQMET